MTTKAFELNEQEQQVIEAWRAGQQDKAGKQEQAASTPAKNQRSSSTYSYEQRLAFVVFAKLAMEGVLDVGIVHTMSMEYVVQDIRDAIVDGLKQLTLHDISLQRLHEIADLNDYELKWHPR